MKYEISENTQISAITYMIPIRLSHFIVHLLLILNKKNRAVSSPK